MFVLTGFTDKVTVFRTEQTRFFGMIALISYEYETIASVRSTFTFHVTPTQRDTYDLIN